MHWIILRRDEPSRRLPPRQLDPRDRALVVAQHRRQRQGPQRLDAPSRGRRSWEGRGRQAAAGLQAKKHPAQVLE